jgi:hypothetical protein
MTARFQVLCLSFFLSATSCKPSQVATVENESETASVAPGESRSWNQHRKNLAVINNAGKAALSCTTGAAIVALELIAETVPILGGVKIADQDAIRRLMEIQGNPTRAGYATAAGGPISAVVDLVGNITNATKMIMIRDYSPPEWSRSWDTLQMAYAGSYTNINRLLTGESSVCRDSISSINNVVMSMFPKKK